MPKLRKKSLVEDYEIRKEQGALEVDANEIEDDAQDFREEVSGRE